MPARNATPDPAAICRVAPTAGRLVAVAERVGTRAAPSGAHVSVRRRTRPLEVDGPVARHRLARRRER